MYYEIIFLHPNPWETWNQLLGKTSLNSELKREPNLLFPVVVTSVGGALCKFGHP